MEDYDQELEDRARAFARSAGVSRVAATIATRIADLDGASGEQWNTDHPSGFLAHVARVIDAELRLADPEDRDIATRDSELFRFLERHKDKRFELSRLVQLDKHPRVGITARAQSAYICGPGIELTYSVTYSIAEGPGLLEMLELAAGMIDRTWKITGHKRARPDLEP